MKNTLKRLNFHPLSAGFTLAEVLVAASLTAIFIGIAGFGLVSMLRNNQNAKASSDIQYNLNRAVEFISDEVRLAIRVETDMNVAMENARNFNLPSGAKPILALQMPGVPQRIIYYVRDKGNNATWLGPQIIYRWGPNFDHNGEYSEDTVNTPAKWQYEPLVDLIANDISGDKKNCSNTSWVRIPAANQSSGAFVCVNGDGRTAEIHASAVANLKSGDSATYDVSTQAFARADKTEGSKYDIPEVCSLDINEDATVKIQPLVGKNNSNLRIPLNSSSLVGSVLSIPSQLIDSGKYVVPIITGFAAGGDPKNLYEMDQDNNSHSNSNLYKAWHSTSANSTEAFSTKITSDTNIALMAWSGDDIRYPGGVEIDNGAPYCKHARGGDALENIFEGELSEQLKTTLSQYLYTKNGKQYFDLQDNQILFFLELRPSSEYKIETDVDNDDQIILMQIL